MNYFRKTLVIAFILLINSRVFTQDISFDFENIEIITFIKTVSKLINKNFIIPEQLKGKVTIISSGKIPISSVFDILEEVLEINGYTIVKSKNIYKIVALKDAKHNALPLYDGEKGGEQIGYATYIANINNISAQELRSIIYPYLSQGGQINIAKSTNTLIICDRIDNLRKIKGIISKLDRITYNGEYKT